MAHKLRKDQDWASNNLLEITRGYQNLHKGALSIIIQ